MSSFFHLSAYKRKGLWKVLPSGLITLAFGVLYLLIEYGILGNESFYPSTGNRYDFAVQTIVLLPISFLLGVGVALMEIFVFDRLFENNRFIVKLVVKSLVYLLIMVSFLIVSTLIANASNADAPIFSGAVLDSLKAFFFSQTILGILLYVGAIITTVLFVHEVFDYFGRRIALAYIFGHYHTPKQENRIFMFMDIKSSTTVAEELGHVQYFKWLNSYYKDITENILQYDGDIYQYVGDEVVISWDMAHGLEHARCLNCFFKIKQGMIEREESYMNEFGVVPRFKAGIHLGEVTTGEIGMIKKDIIYSGDVMNTTARIQDSCNEYGADLLVSGELVAALEGTPNYVFNTLGTIQLRGKLHTVDLYAVEQVSASSA